MCLALSISNVSTTIQAQLLVLSEILIKFRFARHCPWPAIPPCILAFCILYKCIYAMLCAEHLWSSGYDVSLTR